MEYVARQDVIAHAIEDYRRDSELLLHSMLSFCNERLQAFGMWPTNSGELDACLIFGGHETEAIGWR